MNSDKEILIKPKTQNFKTTIEYLNKNIGLTTLCFSVMIAFISGAFKLFSYAFERGKLDYLSINPVYINIAVENRIYSLFLQLTVAVLIIAVNLVPYIILTGRAKFINKLLRTVLTVASVTLISFVYLIFSFFAENQTTTLMQLLKDISSLKLIARYSLIFSILLLLIGITCGIVNNFSSKFSNKDYRRLRKKSSEFNFTTNISKSWITIFIILLAVVAYTLYFYWIGHTASRDMKDYKIIENNQVVLYEGDDFYIISKCEILNSKNLATLNIYSAIQTHIEKNNITTELKKFEKVNVNPQN